MEQVSKRKSTPSLYQKIARKLNIVYDNFRGLDFLSVIQPRDLGLDEKDIFRGSPSGNIFLSNILLDLGISELDNILDIGCSKGDAIRCMTSFPFGKVDGLEISQKLAEIAQKNFLKLKKTNVEIFNIDARQFKKFNEYNFFYLYNPFSEAVMIDVIYNLSKQLGNKEVIIIYNNPTCHSLVEKAGFIKYKQYPDQWGNGIYIYSNKSEPSRFSNF
jgi:hypothetical protein